MWHIGNTSIIGALMNLQIVLGPGLVDQVADDLEALRASAPAAAAGGAGASSAAGASDASGASGSSPEGLAARGASIRATARSRADGRTMRAIRKISAIVIPLIPALIACGLIAGITAS
jgi:PTS system sucrose-specific IIC component